MLAGREVALAVLTLRGRPAAAIVAAGAVAGFDSVTLRLIEPKTGDHGDLVHDRRARRDLTTQLADAGMGLLDVEVVRLRPDTDVRGLLPALDAAAELGARFVLTVCEDPEEGRFVATFGRLAAACRDRGLRAVLEFMRFSECHSLEHAVRLVRCVRERGGDVGVLIDALHLQRSGGNAGQVAIYAEQDPTLFPYVQLCDAPPTPPRGGVAELRTEAVAGRLLPGTGELPLGELLAALPADIPACIETPVRGLEALRDDERAAAAYRSAAGVLATART